MVNRQTTKGKRIKVVGLSFDAALYADFSAVREEMRFAEDAPLLRIMVEDWLASHGKMERRDPRHHPPTGPLNDRRARTTKKA